MQERLNIQILNKDTYENLCAFATYTKYLKEERWDILETLLQRLINDIQEKQYSSVKVKIEKI